MQVLVYNLPEAIRESDLEKLSFAVELSKAFYDDSQEGQQVRTGEELGGVFFFLCFLMWSSPRPSTMEARRGSRCACGAGSMQGVVPGQHSSYG